MADWKLLSTRTIHETPWFKITEDKVLNQNSNPLTYTYLEKGPSVGIVIVNENGNIFLQKQYSYPIKQYHWTTVGGFCDGDDPLVAAKRELYEETGLETNDWQSLGMVYSSAGLSNNPAYYYLARVGHAIIQKRDEEEDLKGQQFMQEEEVRHMLANFEITDSFSVVPLYQYLAKTKGGL